MLRTVSTSLAIKKNITFWESIVLSRTTFLAWGGDKNISKIRLPVCSNYTPRTRRNKNQKQSLVQVSPNPRIGGVTPKEEAEFSLFVP